MPNPYKDIFNDDEQEPKKNNSTPPANENLSFGFSEFEDDGFEMNAEEPLDEILENIETFNQKAEAFSQLLSQTRAVDHKVQSGLASLFVVAQDKYDKGHLGGERRYHDFLISKFENIIAPMRELAEIHLQTVKRFNNDIGEHYFSVEKTDRTVKNEKTMAVDGLNLQRTILADAASSLDILKDSLAQTEKRFKKIH